MISFTRLLELPCVFFLLYPIVAETKCYDPDGKEVGWVKPCRSLGVDTPMCCQLDRTDGYQDDECLPQGICKSHYFEGELFILACESSNWAGDLGCSPLSEICGKPSDGALQVTQCGDGGFCCNNDNTTCCGSANEIQLSSDGRRVISPSLISSTLYTSIRLPSSTVDIVSTSPMTTLGIVSPPVTEFSTLSTHSTSTFFTSQEPLVTETSIPSSDLGLGTGAKAGIAIGAILGALFLAVAAFLLGKHLSHKVRGVDTHGDGLYGCKPELDGRPISKRWRKSIRKRIHIETPELPTLEVRAELEGSPLGREGEVGKLDDIDRRM